MGKHAKTPSVAKNQHVIELDNYLSSIPRGNQGDIDDGRPPPMFLSKDRLADPRHGAAIATTLAARISPFKFVGAICLAVFAVGVLYHQWKMQSEVSLSVEPAPVAAAFTPSARATNLEEAAPAIDDESRLADDMAGDKPPLAGDVTWTDPVSDYRLWVAQQNRATQDKAKPAENEQLLNRLEDWMNKGVR
jgi:hypothetical protein